MEQHLQELHLDPRQRRRSQQHEPQQQQHEQQHGTDADGPPGVFSVVIHEGRNFGPDIQALVCAATFNGETKATPFSVASERHRWACALQWAVGGRAALRRMQSAGGGGASCKVAVQRKDGSRVGWVVLDLRSAKINGQRGGSGGGGAAGGDGERPSGPPGAAHCSRVLWAREREGRSLQNAVPGVSRTGVHALFPPFLRNQHTRAGEWMNLTLLSRQLGPPPALRLSYSFCERPRPPSPPPATTTAVAAVAAAAPSGRSPAARAASLRRRHGAGAQQHAAARAGSDAGSSLDAAEDEDAYGADPFAELVLPPLPPLAAAGAARDGGEGEEGESDEDGEEGLLQLHHQQHEQQRQPQQEAARSSGSPGDSGSGGDEEADPLVDALAAAEVEALLQELHAEEEQTRRRRQQRRREEAAALAGGGEFDLLAPALGAEGVVDALPELSGPRLLESGPEAPPLPMSAPPAPPAPEQPRSAAPPAPQSAPQPPPKPQPAPAAAAAAAAAEDPPPPPAAEDPVRRFALGIDVRSVAAGARLPVGLARVYVQGYLPNELLGAPLRTAWLVGLGSIAC